MYLDGVETRFNRGRRNDDVEVVEMEEEWAIFSQTGHGFGAVDVIYLGQETLERAHRYILFNCQAVNPYIQQHHNEIWRQRCRAPLKEVENIHHKEFPEWFKKKVAIHRGDESFSQKLVWLSEGPFPMARTYHGCIMNGYHFHTKNRDGNKIVVFV